MVSVTADLVAVTGLFLEIFRWIDDRFIGNHCVVVVGRPPNKYSRSSRL
jgi:hypothetical protein